MAKIVIEQIKFDYNIGCRLLKLKHKDCPFPELAEFWDEIKPMTFPEIAKFANVEHRRVGILCLGLDRLIEEVEPILLDKQTINKTTTWITAEGNMETIDFADTYELYKVDGKNFGKRWEGSTQYADDVYFVKFKDTSTDRIYLLWVDAQSVYRTNSNAMYFYHTPENIKKISAIACIAWTMMTTVPKGNIEKIVRQGDCILVKPKGEYKLLDAPRHLTEQEYLDLLVAES